MAAPFATSDDVAARWRPLSPAELQVADVLAGDASSLIRARFPGIDAQVVAGSIDANVLAMVVSGMVKRALIAPADGIASQSETVGPYSHSQTYANPLGNVFLSAGDLTLILGYIPSGSSHKFANDTTACPGGTGYGYYYSR